MLDYMNAKTMTRERLVIPRAVRASCDAWRMISRSLRSRTILSSASLTGVLVPLLLLGSLNVPRAEAKVLRSVNILFRRRRRRRIV